MIRSRDSKGRTPRVQQRQPTTAGVPHTHLDAISAKFSAAGTPSYLLIPVPGIPGSQPPAPPQGAVSRRPHALSSCHSRQQAEQSTALLRERAGPPAQSCLGDQAGMQAKLLPSASCFKVTTATHNCLIAHICLTPRLSSLLVG